ncbi:glycosyltransferase [Scandinavium sp. NPDC088450]|uniref:glycosyltransferase n=1 Tax=Scandinavium sp. NPDC088450 TaxID=3364514 RepID=UPI00385049D4
MKFSVLLSLYFKEKPEHLDACFESIQNQSLKADEIVLVVDGPVGQELNEVVDKWALILPIKILRLSENVGLGKALNEGLDICSNDIVFRMDTDDICCSDRFKIQLNAFDSDNSLMLVGGHIDEYDEGMKFILGKRIVPIGYDTIKEKALFRSPFNHMTVAFKKSMVKNVGGYQHHLNMEDYNLWLRIIAAGYKVDNVNETLVKARTGNSMLGRRKGFDYVKSEFKLFKLKRKLNLQNYGYGMLIFLVRSFPRLLPTSILRFIYKFTRN